MESYEFFDKYDLEDLFPSGQTLRTTTTWIELVSNPNAYRKQCKSDLYVIFLSAGESDAG